jgi:hypothetical protein
MLPKPPYHVMFLRGFNYTCQKKTVFNAQETNHELCQTIIWHFIDFFRVKIRQMSFF